MTLVLCAHGTRSPAGRAAVRALVDAVAASSRESVLDAYVDVHGPALAERLVPGATVVPLFLAVGHHVRVDIGGSAAAVPGVRVSAPLGPSGLLVEVLHDRLRHAGVEPGTAVVLAAAGSSDPSSARAAQRTAAALAERLGAPVSVAYGASRAPSVTDRVAEHRRAGEERIAISSYLLATGHFHRRLLDAGADTVTAPLIADGEVDPRLVALVHERCRDAHRLSA